MPQEERGLHRVIFLERNRHRTQKRTEAENVQGKNAMRTQKHIGHQPCEEPDAGKPHVRFCREAGPVRGRSTRQTQHENRLKALCCNGLLACSISPMGEVIKMTGVVVAQGIEEIFEHKFHGFRELIRNSRFAGVFSLL